MEALLRELWQLREIQELAQLMESGGGPALVTGLSPVHRAMTAAALRLKSGRPLLMLCADEGEARRQAADLRSLTGREPVLLTGRELHWRELAAVSRQWEYRRLEALYRIRQEESPVIVTTADALALRCIPPQVLDRCSFTLRSDGRYQVEELARQLTAAGYTRTEQVEGPGQFALRGGILDVYSPGAEAPVRCEFFDDEVDSLGFFDVATQRRTENCREALLLPAGEVLPLWRDGAAEETAERLETLAGRMKDKPVARQLLSDADLLRQGIIPNGSDRFLAAVYPEMVTAMGLSAQGVSGVRQRKRTHSRGPEGLAEPAEGGRHLRHGERHPVQPHGGGGPVGDGLCPAAGALPRVPAGEPAHQPVSAGSQGPAAD